ncbi:MAG: hypothetical protein AB7P02_06710 [Alphaproteobacteria bacterium]
MVGAFQALVETGRVLGSVTPELGNPELEAALLNLLLFVERAGPVGIVAAWVAGVLAILIARAILLAVIDFVWRATAVWQRPGSPRIARPGKPARPATERPLPGPWSRTPAAPPAQPPRPAKPPPVDPGRADARTPGSAPPAASSARGSVVDRGFRPGGGFDRDGTVVLRRPRGHMEAP